MNPCSGADSVAIGSSESGLSPGLPPSCAGFEPKPFDPNPGGSIVVWNVISGQTLF